MKRDGYAAQTGRRRGGRRRGGTSPFEDLPVLDDPELLGCVALWRAVFTQQLQDAKSRSSKPEAFYNRHTAEFWLYENRDDFEMVCELGYLDPHAARQKALEARERNFVWRAGKPQATRAQPTPHKNRQSGFVFRQLAFEF